MNISQQDDSSILLITGLLDVLGCDMYERAQDEEQWEEEWDVGKDEQHMLTGVAAETSAEDVSDLYVMVMG